MTEKHSTISERVAAIDGVDPYLVREVQVLEKTARGEIVHGAANGRFPRWSLERYVLVIGFVGTALYQVFGLGVSFAGMKRDVSSLEETLRDVRGNLEAHIRLHEQEHEELRREVVPSPSRRRLPAFAPDDALRNGVQR